MQIAKNAVVHIHYTLKNDAGEVLDSSDGSDPLAYLQGHGNLIAGLEKALEGKKVGDSLSVSIPPEEGYGVRDDSLIQDVPRSAFEGIPKVEVGMQFHADSNHGPRTVTVTKVAGDTVTVDGNHPLADQTLHFAVDIVEVRAATNEELSHGHVHGPGGHHH
ncbi:MAG TPA: peptidylprolyl isomerase [Steroidobacteraceae bacterium]|jgi:FKBP-type peptidyl-prolyl cis-trans isomerase SlyD|nr:peptidylprolyl isomerase [Steroidobacteraceae bacterium]